MKPETTELPLNTTEVGNDEGKKKEPIQPEVKTEVKQELQVVDQQYQISSFANKDSFEHVQRVAMVFSKSELVPKKYQGNPANCVIALEMATRMGVSPIMVMQNLDIILGRPAWSSKFLIASLNACGKFSPIRYEEDDKDEGRTRAWAYDKQTGEKLFGVWVSMKMAKSEGWIDKSGSKWKTMPDLMRRYRAASFFTNQYAPEISMGFQTTEEVIDVIAPAEKPSLEALQTLFNEKKDKLNPDQLKSAKRILDNAEETGYQKLWDLLTAL